MVNQTMNFGAQMHLEFDLDNNKSFRMTLHTQ